MITYFRRTNTQDNLEKVENFKSGSWINVVNPNKKELIELSENFNLDIELLQEGLDQYELPRMDHFEDNTYIYVKSTHYETLTISTLLIVIGSNFILTLSKEEVPTLNDFIIGKKTIITTKKLKSLIEILLHLNNDIEKSVYFIVKNVQNKKTLSSDLNNKDLEALLLYEDFLNKLVSNYNYTTILYPKIIKKLKFHEEDKTEIEDLIIESEEGLHICKSSLRTISNITSYYSIILSNNLNRTIKLLTIFTITINIPAAIASIYGMNVKLPFQTNIFVFGYIITLMVILITLFILFIRKK